MATTLRRSISAAVKGVDRSKRQIRFIASRQEVDRDGEVVVTAGIQTANFRKNPIILVDHDRSAIFGRADAVTVGQADGAPALIILATALPPGVSQTADQAYAEILHGARNAFSIGFDPLEWDGQPMFPGQTGRTYRKVDLLEASSVALPSRAGAVVLEKTADDDDEALVLDVDDSPLDLPAGLTPSAYAAIVRQGVAEALGEQIARGIRRAIITARARVDDEEIVLEIANDPRQAAARALQHHLGRTPELIEVAGLNRAASEREVAAITRRAMADAIAEAVTRAVNRARGRVD